MLNTRRFFSTVIRNAHRTFFENLSKEFGLTSWEDWYKVKRKDITDKGAFPILCFYDNSHIQALTELFPHNDWKVWKFNQVPSDFWKEKSNQKKFFDNLAKELKFEKFEDWYSISLQDIREHGGAGLLSNYFKNSIYTALVSVYPQYEWKKYLFLKGRVSEYWKSIENQRNFFEDLAKKLNYKNLDGFYSINKSQIEEFGGGSLLERYGGSFIKALESAFPDYKWKIHKFDHVPEGHWTVEENRRIFFDEIAKELGIKHWEDWYSIKKEDIVKAGGGGLLKQFRDSNITAITETYREFKWQIWKFTHVPKGFWTKKENVKKVLEDIYEELGMSRLDDWYGVTTSQMHGFGCSTLIFKYGGIIPMLQDIYPEHQWDDQRSEPIKTQKSLFKYLMEIFPRSNLQLDYVSTMTYSKSKKNMQFDVFFPVLNLAFEYQGGQHYFTHYFYGSPEELQKRDEEKRNACKKEGITLIEIPYWWDSRKQSLLATIAKYRPELVRDEVITEAPISDTPPKSFPIKTLKEKWKEYEEYPNGYIVSEGSPIGAVPKCRGCQKKFRDRKELRVHVKATFYPGTTTPTPGRAYFCLNTNCINDAYFKDSARNPRTYTVEYPKFEGIIYVPKIVQVSLLPKLVGVNWEVIE